MSYRFWASSFVLLLCCFVAIFAFMARTPLCIDSILVEKIDKGQGSAVMYSCASHTHVPYDAFFAEQAAFLSKRLQKLQMLTEWVQPLQKAVHIQIVDKKEAFFEIDNHKILISENLLLNEGALEKAIIKIWLREKLLAQDILIEEVVSDLYAYAFSGNILTTENAVWPRVLQNMSGYCQSSWRSLEHTMACARLNLISSQDAQSVTLLSLRPLLSQALIKSYELLDVADRLSFLKQLPEQIVKYPLASLKADKGIPEAAQFVLSFNESVRLMAEKSELFAAFRDRWMTELKVRGFSESPEFSWVDGIFFLSNKNNEDLIFSLKAQSEKLQQMTLVAQDDHQFWLLPQTQAIEKSGVGSIKAMRGILFNCGPISTHKILQLEGQVQKLLIVDQCQKKTKVDYQSYFKRGAEGFANANKDISFMSIHIPSLRMALLRSGTIPMELTATETWKLIQKQASFDTKTKAYYVKSETDAFDWFR